MDYVKLYDSFQTYYEAKKAKLVKPRNPFNDLPRDFCTTLTRELSNIELRNKTDSAQYVPGELVSATKTLLNIESPQAKGAMSIAFNISRSDILGCVAKDNPEYASLTPLFMWAHKKYHKVPYEAWDKKDPMMEFALGKFLKPLLDAENVISFAEIQQYLLDNPEDHARLRAEHLNDKNATGYFGRMLNFEINDTPVKLAGSSCVTKMLMQTWLAHASIRVPKAMILDPTNWDAIPKGVDGTNKEVKEAMKLPWDD